MVSTIGAAIMIRASIRNAAARSLASASRIFRSTPSGVTSSRSKRSPGGGGTATGGVGTAVLAIGRSLSRPPGKVEISRPDQAAGDGDGVADGGDLNQLPSNAL